MSDWTYPRYAAAERIADGAVHVIGVTLALFGGAALLFLTQARAENAPVAAVAVYCAALAFGFAASAIYHMSPWERPRLWLRRVDHAAIYLKIAATYTPIVALIGTGFAWAVLAVVWALAAAGATAKIAFWRSPTRLGPWLYLGLGWLSVLLIWPVAQTLPGPAVALIAVGGLLYSAGVIFFNWEKLKFAMAIWHGFVLAASGCFFGAILIAILAAGAVQ